jgi:hypothetical protein
MSNNKKDSVFASWDKDSYTERFLALLPGTSVLQPKLIHHFQASSLLPGHLPILTSVPLRLLYWLFCCGDIKHFQVWVSYLSPFLPYVLSLSMWPKSNNTTAFALDLKYIYEGGHMIFGLLSLANLAQDDVFQFHQFTCKYQNFILLHGWVKFHCV